MKYGNVLTESSSKPLKHHSVPKKPDKIIGITNSHPEGAAQGISGLCSHSECSGSLSSGSLEHSQGLIAFPQHFLAISLHLVSEGMCKAQQVPNRGNIIYLLPPWIRVPPLFHPSRHNYTFIHMGSQDAPQGDSEHPQRLQE